MRGKCRAESLKATRRSKEEIKKEILNAINEDKEGPRRTNIGMKCNLNYLAASTMTEEMEHEDKTIKRDEVGRYSLTGKGKATVKRDMIGIEKCMEIVEIATRMARTDELTDELICCRFCGKDGGEHEQNCDLARLMELVNT